MKTVVGAAVLALAGAAAGAEAPLMTVLIRPGKVDPAVSRGDIDVVMTIPGVSAAAGQPFLSMGMFIPGLARPQAMRSLFLADAAGPAPVTETFDDDGVHRWAPARALKGTVTVRYRLLAENIPALKGGPPTALRVDGDAVSAEGGSLLVSPAVTGDYRIAVKWDVAAMGKGAEGVSSWGDGDVMLPAGPVSRLGRAVYMAGHLGHETDGAFSAVWAKGQPPFDPVPPMKWTAELHRRMSAYFHDKSEPPYRVFMRFNPMNAGGGAALTHSFIITYGKDVTGENFKAILGHEMTHTWTANEIGNWYDEGDAVYYQALIPWRSGLMTTDQYLADLNGTAYRYFTNALRDLPEDQVAPRFWEDTRIRVLPYDRGAMYFAVLNGKIRRASGGKRGVDDLVLVMIDKAKRGEALSEQVWLDLLQKELGADGPAAHRNMMAGGLVLPETDDFGPCFQRVTKKMRRFDLGFDNASILTNPKVIKGLKADSEAAKAGLKDGDVVTYAVALDAVQGDLDRKLELKVTRGGKTFPLAYRPRGAEVEAYQWERRPGAPDDASCKVF
jgi:predicted metalloprotease with PDZ domain